MHVYSIKSQPSNFLYFKENKIDKMVSMDVHNESHNNACLIIYSIRCIGVIQTATSTAETR